ncbi:hypothetical protein BCON_0289g00100 [Botryotinia convoluta]|uniref:Uncharacterized protein n=1 Tax=Botryotinia convoluta TaxID=54673 RepID=A0A4Z1HIY3_9HELO|nr:hypothetical protein BCON_0289g00100 [Botryotinia convoluta]
MSSGDTQAEEWNCTSYPALVANPDIGGIGTILAFVISVYLTLICCVAKARIDHLRSPDKDTPRLDVWSFALGNVILNFSDQQVALGIAVLIAGVSQLSSRLDSYHWQTVLNLASFSSFTHILTLTALRAENRSNNKIKVIRVVAMGVLAVILMCMVYTAGWLGWLSFALVWGTVRIFTIRNLPNSQGNLDSSESMSAILSEENDWVFGQTRANSLEETYSSPPDAMSLRKKIFTDAQTSPDTSSDYERLPSSIDLSQTYTTTSTNMCILEWPL